MSEPTMNQSTPYGTITLDPTPPPDAVGLTRGRRPAWLRVKPVDSPKYRELKDLFRGQRLHTVCEEAMCPQPGRMLGAARPPSCSWATPARLLLRLLQNQHRPRRTAGPR